MPQSNLELREKINRSAIFNLEEYSLLNLGQLLGYRKRLSIEIIKNNVGYEEYLEAYNHVENQIKQLLNL